MAKISITKKESKQLVTEIINVAKYVDKREYVVVYDSNRMLDKLYLIDVTTGKEMLTDKKVVIPDNTIQEYILRARTAIETRGMVVFRKQLEDEIYKTELSFSKTQRNSKASNQINGKNVENGSELEVSEKELDLVAYFVESNKRYRSGTTYFLEQPLSEFQKKLLDNHKDRLNEENDYLFYYVLTSTSLRLSISNMESYAKGELERAFRNNVPALFDGCLRTLGVEETLKQTLALFDKKSELEEYLYLQLVKRVDFPVMDKV